MPGPKPSHPRIALAALLASVMAAAPAFAANLCPAGSLGGFINATSGGAECPKDGRMMHFGAGGVMTLQATADYPLPPHAPGTRVEVRALPAWTRDDTALPMGGTNADGTAGTHNWPSAWAQLQRWAALPTPIVSITVLPPLNTPRQLTWGTCSATCAGRTCGDEAGTQTVTSCTPGTGTFASQTCATAPTAQACTSTCGPPCNCAARVQTPCTAPCGGTCAYVSASTPVAGNCVDTDTTVTGPLRQPRGSWVPATPPSSCYDPQTYSRSRPMSCGDDESQTGVSCPAVPACACGSSLHACSAGVASNRSATRWDCVSGTVTNRCSTPQTGCQAAPPPPNCATRVQSPCTPACGSSCSYVSSSTLVGGVCRDSRTTVHGGSCGSPRVISPWGACSAYCGSRTCGSVSGTQSRSCTPGTGSYASQTCSGVSTSRPCSASCGPTCVVGSPRSLGSWGGCSASCAGRCGAGPSGTQTRSCTPGTGTYASQTCAGLTSRPCRAGNCGSTARYGSWTAFGACSARCTSATAGQTLSGSRTRSRSCTPGTGSCSAATCGSGATTGSTPCSVTCPPRRCIQNIQSPCTPACGSSCSYISNSTPSGSSCNNTYTTVQGAPCQTPCPMTTWCGQLCPDGTVPPGGGLCPFGMSCGRGYGIPGPSGYGCG